MKPNTAHTPGTWEVSSGTIIASPEGKVLAQCAPIGIEGFDVTLEEAEANAAHIVHCVNCHEELVAHLKMAKDLIASLMDGKDEASKDIHTQIREMIAREEGK